LDLGMPGMGGLECLREIKKINAQARVLVASGYSGSKMIDEAMRAGASGFLAKPYRLMEMMHKVRDVLDRS